MVGGIRSTKVEVPVLKRARSRRETRCRTAAACAVAARRTVTRACVGKPAPPGVKVSVSCAGDQEKVPLAAGRVEKADATLPVSIGWLNCRTMGAHVGDAGGIVGGRDTGHHRIQRQPLRLGDEYLGDVAGHGDGRSLRPGGHA